MMFFGGTSSPETKVRSAVLCKVFCLLSYCLEISSLTRSILDGSQLIETKRTAEGVIVLLYDMVVRYSCICFLVD